MTDPLTEAVARAIAKSRGYPDAWPIVIPEAEAALAIARPAIRREALQEAIRVAEIYDYGDLADEDGRVIRPSLAITDLMEKPDEPR